MNAERTADICIALACATAVAMWALVLSAPPAHAEMIKPNCWEDKAADGTVQRHCEVNRAAPPKASAPPHLRNDAGAPPPAVRPQAPPPRHQPFNGRYVGPESVPPYSPAFGPAEGAPYYRSPQLYDFAGPAPVYAQPASPYYQPCVTASDDGFVEVKDGPNEWAFNVQVLPNGVPLGAATYGYQVPYVPGGEVWVFVQTDGLQGWARLGSLACQ